MLASEYIKAVEAGENDAGLSHIYANINSAKKRIINALTHYIAHFGDDDVAILSAPGRTEISGNHTDYNNGAVLAAAVELDVLAIASPLANGRVEMFSRGYGLITLSLDNLNPVEREKHTTQSLVRGTAAGIVSKGHIAGGFKAYVESDVPGGSGLSSSAAFEVLLCVLQSHLYNKGLLTPRESAFISREAENKYFGKPCGLMDQMASAVGGFIKIDFLDPLNPVVTPISFMPRDYILAITDTKGDHEELTGEYAACARETLLVAKMFNKNVLRDVDEKEFFNNARKIREECGDRAFIRAAHFFYENNRVHLQGNALLNCDTQGFIDLVKESGKSSFQYLQNIYVSGETFNQPISAALCYSEYLLKNKGAARVHGGGFAGTIQAFVPKDMLKEYKQGMDYLFGANSCITPGIRLCGMTRVL